MKNLALRILSAIFFLALVFFAPWWFSFLVGLIFLAFYKNFWELVLGGLIIDLLFGVPLPQFGNFTLLLSVVSLLLLLGRQMLARQVFERA